jgi:hypothetical protein
MFQQEDGKRRGNGGYGARRTGGRRDAAIATPTRLLIPPLVRDSATPTPDNAGGVDPDTGRDDGGLGMIARQGWGSWGAEPTREAGAVH